MDENKIVNELPIPTKKKKTKTFSILLTPDLEYGSSLSSKDYKLIFNKNLVFLLYSL